MALTTNKLGTRDHSATELDGVRDSGPGSAANAALNDAKINYLKMMTMTLLNELNSLTEGRREPVEHGMDLKAEVQRFESELIRSALSTTHGQQRRAARLLGTNATTLNTKLKRGKIWTAEDAADSFALTPASDSGFTDDDGHSLTFETAMDRYEISLIRNALVQTGGNQSRAARLLGLPITTLNSKIKKLKLDVPRHSDLKMDLAVMQAGNQAYGPWEATRK